MTGMKGEGSVLSELRGPVQREVTTLGGQGYSGRVLAHRRIPALSVRHSPGLPLAGFGLLAHLSVMVAQTATSLSFLLLI